MFNLVFSEIMHVGVAKLNFAVYKVELKLRKLTGYVMTLKFIGKYCIRNVEYVYK